MLIAGQRALTAEAHHPTERSDFVERIVASYLAAANGDAAAALRHAIADALADLCGMERRTRRAERLISRGFVRAEPAEAIAAPGRQTDT